MTSKSTYSELFRRLGVELVREVDDGRRQEETRKICESTPGTEEYTQAKELERYLDTLSPELREMLNTVPQMEGVPREKWIPPIIRNAGIRAGHLILRALRDGQFETLGHLHDLEKGLPSTLTDTELWRFWSTAVVPRSITLKTPQLLMAESTMDDLIGEHLTVLEMLADQVEKLDSGGHQVDREKTDCIEILEAVIAVAQTKGNDDPVKMTTIATFLDHKHGYSPGSLNRKLAKLCRQRYLQSVRGSGGGYRITDKGRLVIGKSKP